jgi:CRISPR-associated protein Csd1
MGSPLIGYDKEAFLSYGLKQSANGAVSEEAACAYRAALNCLLEEHSQQLAGAKVAHWFSHSVPPAEDPLAWLACDEDVQELSAQRRAAEMLRCIRSGERPDLLSNHYYALTLSGASGRVMVRDWMQGQFEELVEGVAAWFEDLEIVNHTGSGLARNPRIERAVTCLLPKKPPHQDWVRPLGSVRFDLWRAALKKGTPLPLEALTRIVLLNRTFAQTGELEDAVTNQRDLGLTISVLHARMGLLKAYHLRSPKGGTPMKAYLNEDHTDPAYQCGRLMAVLARLQRAALGDVGAGVVQRFFGAASATPALVLGRLTRNSQFHLNKLEPGLAYWHETRIADIWSRIKDSVPGVLGFEQQSLFALGYYQQIAADRPRPIADDSNANQEDINV